MLNTLRKGHQGYDLNNLSVLLVEDNELLAKPVSASQLYERIERVVEIERPFIRTPEYFGPCRRRRADPKYSGAERRTRKDPPSQTR